MRKEQDFLKFAGLFLAIMLYLATGPSLAVAQIAVALPDTETVVGEVVSIPVTLSDVTGEGVVSAQVVITYDSDVVELTENPVSVGAMAPGWNFQHSVALGVGSTIDTVKIAMSTTTDTLSASGELVVLHFLGGNAGTSPLHFVRAILNEGLPPVNTEDGGITVYAPPVVSDILDRTILEGEMFSAFSLDSYVSDADDSDAELTWSTSGNTELTVNISASRVVSIGIPDVNWHGWETITFTASDSTGLSDGDAVKFIVEPVNDAPAARDVHLSPSSPAPSDTLVVGYSFTDVDGDSESGTELRWFKDGSLQSDYNDSRSVLPVATAKGESWHSVVRPKDGTAFGGAVHSDTVLIGNTAPRFLGPWEEEVELWETLRFVVRASDADGDELECVVDASSLPAGATFSAATWTFSWRPGEGQEAEEDPYEVRFRISDGSSGSVTGVVEIYVYVPLGLRMVRAPSAIGVTDYEAVVWWETNMASDSWVVYGLDAGYGQSAGSSVGVTDHRVPLLDLEPDTTYYYRAYSASAPDTVWGTGTFHTQADTSSPSVLTGPDVVGVTDSEATVLWETNEKSDTWVSYGYDGGLGLESGRLEWVRTHRVRLTDLASDTTITLRVHSSDRAGNVGLSGVVTFLTHPA
ncbi:MAG: hypothetical protein KAJ05_06025, partial [Candidatus Latescibacteria bacterium]|nr:hypothetical protein [Candidatus Latescibacterota bacterium]